MLQADSGLLFVSFLGDTLRNLFGVDKLPNMVQLCCAVQSRLFLANGSLSVNKLFQCKLSNVGHLRISDDECHRNNHGFCVFVHICLWAFVF